MPRCCTVWHTYVYAGKTFEKINSNSSYIMIHDTLLAGDEKKQEEKE